MTDRYGGRYLPRARSPPLFNPARASLPINISGYAPPSHDGNLHAVSTSRREVITDPRSSNNSVNNGGTITTTYKIKADPPTRGSSVREGSRTRRSTVDNNSRPPVTAVVTTTPRHRPVVHGDGGPRPASPIKNPYRSSEEEYVAIPATSRHGHHHRKHHSSHMDSGDLNRISSERDGGRLRVAPVREHAYTTRSRPSYVGTGARHPDNVADDYGDNGYLYTKPGDLAQYDLDQNEPVYRRPRRDSFDAGNAGRAGRPSSITGYGDLVPRSYDTRERGPPPSTRGFDKIRAPTWDQPVRMPVPPSPLDGIHRPFDPIEPPRRSNSRVRASTYHDRDPRRGPREEIYEVKDDHKRQHRRERYDESVEQRGFGIRTDRPERPERIERSERAEPSHRPERTDRPERVERSERSERAEEGRPRDKEHKSRDVLAAGISIASAALGLNAVKNATHEDRDDRDDRDERRRRDDKEESRRDRDDREVDLSGRDPKERRSRDEEVPARKVTPPRDTPSPRDKDHRDRIPANADLNDRDPKDRRTSKDERSADTEHREHRKSIRSDTLESPSDDTSASEETATRPRRERRQRDSVPGQAAFNPKDTMDLKALKEALNSKDTPKANSGETRTRTPRESTTKDALEVAEIRKDLKDDRRSREPLAPAENKQLRVVSPPREKPEEKPVKGILRQPREKFPEDPAPIREGVAPLKDAKKDGIPPDARWTKISRRLVNPEALEAGKERFEAREDFVIVLRVLSKEEVQGYAEVTERIRATREDLYKIEADDRRKARRARHERHKRERNGEIPRSDRSERRQHHRSGRDRDSESHSESDSSETDYDDDRVSDKPKMLEAAPRKKSTFEEALMSGGLADMKNIPTGPTAINMGNLKETAPGQYSGYVRNPPPPLSAVAPRKDSK